MVPLFNILNLLTSPISGANKRGKNLTEVEVLPHYSKFLQRFEGFEEKCAAYEKKYGREVIRLNDGEGVAICQQDNI